jgi:hypothetical protein
MSVITLSMFVIEKPVGSSEGHPALLCAICGHAILPKSGKSIYVVKASKI